jgi:MoxR-like ATPase
MRSTEPEVLYQVLEDRRLVTPTGVLDFPKITVVGATTDEGMLPDPFINRFPLRPVLEPYKQRELTPRSRSQRRRARGQITMDAARTFARAAVACPGRSTTTSATAPCSATVIDVDLAEEVVRELNRTTDDGLTLDMQRALVFLYRRGKRTNRALGTSPTRRPWRRWPRRSASRATRRRSSCASSRT